jgi:hypothetical protein
MHDSSFNSNHLNFEWKILLRYFKLNNLTSIYLSFEYFVQEFFYYCLDGMIYVRAANESSLSEPDLVQARFIKVRVEQTRETFRAEKSSLKSARYYSS